jgi:hypothetical protein
MARGNQRDKAREKNQKAAAGTVRPSPHTALMPDCTARTGHCLLTHLAEGQEHRTLKTFFSYDLDEDSSARGFGDVGMR